MRGQGANGREGDRENSPSSVFLLLAAGAPSLALLMADAPLLDPLGCTHTHIHTHTHTGTQTMSFYHGHSTTLCMHVLTSSSLP